MRRFVLSIASLSALMLPMTHAAAAPVLASGAAAAQIQLRTGGVATASLTAAGVSGSTPGHYDLTTSATANQSFTLVDGGLLLPDVAETLTAGLATSRAAGDPGLGTAYGTTSLANVSSLLGTALFNIGLTAGTIGSTTSVSFGADGFGGTGSSLLAGLSFSGGLLGGLGLDAGLLANPLANTRLVTLPGLSVILNEQLASATATSLFRQTNAVHIALDDFFLGGQALSGDIILGHSEARLSGFSPVGGAVPEPASWALMLAGFGVVGFTLRSQRRRHPAQALSLG